MNKVYCKDCKYRKRLSDSEGYRSNVYCNDACERLSKTYTLYDPVAGPQHRIFYVDCLCANKQCDCDHFEQKVSFWQKVLKFFRK